MSQALSLQDVINRLQTYWAKQGCIIWQPYYTQVGAGTMNPATALRVLGPEPWNVAYVEPSVRPDDGRYGDNPNRMQLHYQFQVIIKPDPGNPQELYLQSLEALGINRREHDIRFVEDNWEWPAGGAWGLGWEVWLDGQEITQFTYFQQAGGQALMPNSVEITYGLERIVLALQGVNAVWELQWNDALTYGDVLLQSEIEHCRYYFEVADVEALKQVYNTYEREGHNALAYDPPLVIPAYDYLLKCSHLFNVLDTRGAIGVVERADYFRRMQRLSTAVGRAYVEQRARLEYPILPDDWTVDAETGAVILPEIPAPEIDLGVAPTKPAEFLLEIGTEELPAADLDSALAQLRELVPALLEVARLDYEALTVSGTPRRLVVYLAGLSPNQRAKESIKRGPPAKVAFDAKGKPTKAAEGFARSIGVETADLERQEVDGGEYVVAQVRDEGRPTVEILADLMPGLIAALRFAKTMRWNESGVTFSRPLRWFVALFGDAVVPFKYAAVYAGRATRGARPLGSPEADIKNAAAYFKQMAKWGILIDQEARRAEIAAQIEEAAEEAGGRVYDDPGLLDEVTNLVEQPTAVLGTFDEKDLELPVEVLMTVMKKHQRYFAVVDKKGNLLPHFITVRNGDDQHLDIVADGNEHVIRARFADARFFFNEDIKQPLVDYVPDLKSLTFQEDIGSYYEKAARIEGLTARIGAYLGLEDDNDELEHAIRAARLAKADLVTSLVVEMTSLQGEMGRIYALRSGEPDGVANAIAEHYYPRFAGDDLPASQAGTAIALADRLDSLVGLFSVGMLPTGSADPYGLRRAAQGIVAILLGQDIDLDLWQAVEWAAQGYTQELGENAITDQTIEEVIAFIAGRLDGTLRETFHYDAVAAVLAEQAHNPYRAREYIVQLSGWVARDGWEALLDGYARCARITRDQKMQYDIDPKGFTEPAEKALYTAYLKAADQLGEDADVDAFLSAVEAMIPAISTFFAPADEGGVLVMAEDKKVRANRLGLLQRIVALGGGIVDLSQMEGF